MDRRLEVLGKKEPGAGGSENQTDPEPRRETPETRRQMHWESLMKRQRLRKDEKRHLRRDRGFPFNIRR